LTATPYIGTPAVPNSTNPPGALTARSGLRLPAFLFWKTMNLKDQARIWIKTVVGNHLGRNIRTFKFVTYTGETLNAGEIHEPAEA
jgi:hypothetical protein